MRRSTLSSPRKTIAVSAPGRRSRFSAKFSRASGKKRVSRIAAAGDDAALALLADDAAEIPDEIPERARIRDRPGMQRVVVGKRRGRCAAPASAAEGGDRQVGERRRVGRPERAVGHRSSARVRRRRKDCHSARTSAKPPALPSPRPASIASRAQDGLPLRMKRIAWILAAVVAGRRRALRAARRAAAARGAEDARSASRSPPGPAATCRCAASRRSTSSRALTRHAERRARRRARRA